MDTFSYHELPFIAVLCVFLLIPCAFIDLTKLKVPNVLTYFMILTGWLYGGLLTWGVLHTRWPGEDMSYLSSSLLLTVVGFGLLFPMYAIGGMGAGDVKMQMGYGAWVGAHYGWDPGWRYLVFGFCVAAIAGGIIAIGMMWWRGDFRQNRANFAAILHDLMNPTKAAEAAAKRKSRMQLLPFGVPLCIGYITYIVYCALG